jgi:hypothetical protein
MEEEIMSEPPSQCTSNFPASIPNAVASSSASTIPHVSGPSRTSEDIPFDTQLLDNSATLEPDRAPRNLRIPDSSLSMNSLPHQPILDPDQQDVFELFHDALELLGVDVNLNDDTLLMVTSTSTDEAADALYPRLRQLLSTGKAEPLPPFSATSICNLDIKALDRTKISANM